MHPTIPQNSALVKNLMTLLAAHRPLFGQQRVFNRVIALVLGEVFAFARHTVTQLLMVLGLNDSDWSAWYRLFSRGHFQEAKVADVMLQETLRHVGPEAVYVVAGDGTQVPRDSRKMEGTSWLRCPRTPVFKLGIHRAQRWFHGAWLLPAEKGYSRAMPLRWLPAFTAKAVRQLHAACKEWEAAVLFVRWLRQALDQVGRSTQRVLMVVDGSYDTLGLWQALPEGVTVLARSAKNRVLYHLPAPDTHRNRKYGQRAPTPQQVWQQRKGWTKLTLFVRGRDRRLQYRVSGPFLRKGAAHRPLCLIVVRGKDRRRSGRRYTRKPLPFLVNAVQDAHGDWVLPLAIETLLFWAWQRWEIEVAHRELKSNFGLGDKQCWNPTAAVASVQWSAWVYALLLLAAYRSWGLCGAPSVPTRWWRGSGRWSFNTLWRAYRAAFWGSHDFRPLYAATPGNWGEKEARLDLLRNAVFAAARA